MVGLCDARNIQNKLSSNLSALILPMRILLVGAIGSKLLGVGISPSWDAG